MPRPKGKHAVLAAVTMLLLVGVPPANGQPEKDPHRPPCTSARCKKIKSFLKLHYCGESPSGNGPDDGCDTRRPKKLTAGRVTADFQCKWNETEGKSKCQQRGQPTPEIRSILMLEMRRLGLPARLDKELYFTVWKLAPSGWSLAAADYDHASGIDLMLCQVILIIDQSAHVRVLRKVPYTKTDADVPEVTTWTPLDLADVDGDGRIEVILEGDAYENHWLEVDSLKDGPPHTIFSGLGYYL